MLVIVTQKPFSSSATLLTSRQINLAQLLSLWLTVMKVGHRDGKDEAELGRPARASVQRARSQCAPPASPHPACEPAPMHLHSSMVWVIICTFPRQHRSYCMCMTCGRVSPKHTCRLMLSQRTRADCSSARDVLGRGGAGQLRQPWASPRAGTAGPRVERES